GRMRSTGTTPGRGAAPTRWRRSARPGAPRSRSTRSRTTRPGGAGRRRPPARAEVRIYAIAHDRAEGVRALTLADAPAFVAEGIFAAEIVADCRAAGVLGGAFVLRRPRHVTWLRRLVRDLRERRKPP